MKDTIWKETVTLPSFETLHHSIDTEVLIIGGGMAGLLCAYYLHRKGISCTIVEANTIASGVTQGTTAKITAQHGYCYEKLIQTHGMDSARHYLQANLDALAAYKKLCQTIDCDFKECDAYAYACDPTSWKKEYDALRCIGYEAKLTDVCELPFPITKAIVFPDQAQFHPLKFIKEIIKGLTIYEHTRIQKVKGTTAYFASGCIRAKKIIVTTHFPFINSHGSYFMKMYQHRSYVLVLKHAKHLKHMYMQGDGKGLSFRSYQDLLLLGGGGHRSGETKDGWKTLQTFAKQYFPQAEILGKWATQDCMTLDGMPYIGQYAKFCEDMYVASGFHKWGMTSSMLAAQILTRKIGKEKKQAYDSLFSPSRSMLHPQLFYNGMETMKHLLSFSPKRCSHMGCALQWNPYEHTWDCPCHGSRFEQTGTLLDNPANKDLKK